MIRLIHHFSNLHEHASRGTVQFRKRYDAICHEWLGGLTVLGHKSKILREQLGPHLDNLVASQFLRSYLIENLIERAVLLSPGKELRVPLSELKPSPLSANGNVSADLALFSPSPSSVPITTLEEAERQHILRALRQTEWRIAGPKGAAAILGMKRTTLQARMRKLGIRRPI